MHWLRFRYLLKELVPSFCLGLLVFTLVLLMGKIMRIVEMIIAKGVPLGDVLKLFACLLPNFLLLTLPTALLLSTLVTFSRLCLDNEYTAWRVAGISLYQLLTPVYVFGAIVFSLAMCVSAWMLPTSTKALQSMLYSVATKNVVIGIKERVFFDDFPGIVVYVDRIEPDQKKVHGIFIADQNVSPGPVLYFANEGSFRTEEDTGRLTVTLKKGSIHRNLVEKDIYDILYFDTYTAHLRLDQTVFPQADRTLKNDELTLGELLDRIHEKAAKGEPVRGDWVDFHNRIALPFACFVFCTLGVPLALGSQRAVRYTGFSLSIGVVLLYFVFMKTGWGMAAAGRVPPWLGPWLPNLVLGGLGVYLLIQKAREAPIKILDWYGERVGDLLEWVRTHLTEKGSSSHEGRGRS